MGITHSIVSLAEGIRITIQFIHSRPFYKTYKPHHFSFILPLSASLYYTACFPRQTNQPTTHPLSHIITRPLWKCVSLPFDTTRRRRSGNSTMPLDKQTGFGVGIHILHTTIDSFTIQQV